ncbi:MAG: hypothetical protein ACRD26_04315, partial [Vicinamibacterales bacterium]
ASDERRALVARAGPVLAGSALLWLLGVLALARGPRSADPPAAAVPPGAGEESLAQTPLPIPSVDLVEAASVCTELARLPSGAALPSLLARAAGVLDAPGLIVWLGAGEELFAASSHGYDRETLARLGLIPRTGDNATAAAWRAAAMFTVSGGPAGTGAIVAPLVRPDGCFGVLAAEVRHGRERDEATRALTAMIAAQLSAVVAPWPQPSHADAPLQVHPDEVAVAGGHDTPAPAAASA